MKLTTRITALFLLLSVVPLAIVGVLAYRDGRDALQQSTIDRLRSTTILKEAELNRWLEGNERSLRALAQRPSVIDHAGTLADSDTTVADHENAYDRLLHDHLQPALLDEGGWKRLFVLHPDSGEILAATDSSIEGTSRNNELFFLEGRLQTTIQNPNYSLPLHELVMTVSTPVVDDNGDLIAVLAGHLDLSEMNEIVSHRSGLSETEETYLVSSFNYLVTTPRLDPTSALDEAIYTAGVTECLKGNDGWGLYEDYRDEPVLGVYRWLPERELCIITEVNQREAFSPILDLRTTIFGVGLAIALGTGVLGLVFTQSLTHPIRQLVISAEELGEGNLDYRVSTDRQDELGTLAEAFNQMAADLGVSQEALRRVNEELEQRVEERTADLKASEERFRKIFEAVPVPLSITRMSDGLVLAANNLYAPALRIPPDEVIGRKTPDFYEDPADRESLLADLLKKGFDHGRELRIRRADGSLRWILLSIQRLTFNGEEALLSGFQDITERKAVQEDLKRSNEELERFAYVASHDLQEPLRMVTSYLQLIEHRYQGKLDEDADDFIHFAVDGANRMKTLIQDLLAYSRVGTRGKPMEPVDCEGVVDRVSSDLLALIEETDAQITHDPLPTVHADPTQMQQLFSNLIGNAVKFRGDDPPRIHIGVQRQGDEWRFCVQDNGIGFDAGEYGKRIFVIFQRLHTKAEYGGTGIGLSICKKIVERHGGRIWVESEPGEGATFYFTLPVMEEKHAAN
jgi:PAS domain S-box-containing protein